MSYQDDPLSLASLRTEVGAGPTENLVIQASVSGDLDFFSKWDGCALIVAGDGWSFLGVRDDAGIALNELVRSHLSFVASFVVPSYGIGYIHPFALSPGKYAIGIGGGPVTRSFSPEMEAYGKMLSRWASDLYGDRRHLSGWFRDVYPVQYLNEKHVSAELSDGRTLLTAGIGTLTSCGSGRWLWELAETEIAPARQLLAANDLLLCSVEPQ